MSYEVMDDERVRLIRVQGIMRRPEYPHALVVLLTDVPTDDEMRDMHEHLRFWGRDPT